MVKASADINADGKQLSKSFCCIEMKTSRASRAFNYDIHTLNARNKHFDIKHLGKTSAWHLFFILLLAPSIHVLDNFGQSVCQLATLRL